MKNEMPTHTDPSLEMSFSSLSVSPTEKSRRSFSADHTTRKMVERMGQLRSRLHPVIDASVSLHLGDLTDVSLAGELLREEGIRITSLDRADVYPGVLVLKDILREIREKI